MPGARWTSMPIHWLGLLFLPGACGGVTGNVGDPVHDHAAPTGLATTIPRRSPTLPIASTVAPSLSPTAASPGATATAPPTAVRATATVLPMAVTVTATSPALPTSELHLGIDRLAFQPATMTVPVGATVVWTNQEPVPHTVAHEDLTTSHSPRLAPTPTSARSTQT